MLGCLVRRPAGSLHLFDTGAGQQDHEWGVMVPVLLWATAWGSKPRRRATSGLRCSSGIG
jgi:hypothetical protein